MPFYNDSHCFWLQALLRCAFLIMEETHMTVLRSIAVPQQQLKRLMCCKRCFLA